VVLIKKQKIKGYILFESLLALGILVYIVLVILGAIEQYQQLHNRYIQEEEALNAAISAIQTQKDSLAINNVEIIVHSTAKEMRVNDKSKELFHVTKISD